MIDVEGPDHRGWSHPCAGGPSFSLGPLSWRSSIWTLADVVICCALPHIHSKPSQPDRGAAVLFSHLPVTTEPGTRAPVASPDLYSFLFLYMCCCFSSSHFCKAPVLLHVLKRERGLSETHHEHDLRQPLPFLKGLL